MNKGKICKKHICGRMAAILAASLLLTGCGNTIPDMTEEEAQAVGDYAAMTLLRYDANHRSRLVDLSQVREKTPKPEESTPEPEQPEETPAPASDTPVVDLTQEDGRSEAGSMEDFFELPEGVTLVYQGMQVCSSYPESGADSFFSLDASEGKKLLVLNYTVSNQSSAAQYVDLFGQKPVFKITVNESYTRTALVTILLNDMSTYAKELEAGASENVVLLIEINEDTEEITSISLNLKSNSKAYTAPLM